jgi:hypothetical protein
MRGDRIVVNDVDAAGLGPERNLNRLHYFGNEFGTERTGNCLGGAASKLV